MDLILLIYDKVCICLMVKCYSKVNISPIDSIDTKMIDI